MVISRENSKLIEQHLYNHEEEKKRLKQRKIEIAENIVHAADKTGIRGSMKSDPTYTKALKIEAETALLQAWVDVIEDTFAYFKGTETGEFMQDVYCGWARYTDAANMYVSKSTYYRKREDVVTYAAIKAYEKNLINV